MRCNIYTYKIANLRTDLYFVHNMAYLSCTKTIPVV